MKMYSNTISIVHSNFRRKESLYLFIGALFLSWTDTGFRDLQFSLVQSTQMGSDTSRWSYLLSKWSANMRFPLPFMDWRAHSILLLRYHTRRRRIEWEVWRFISTPGTDESMAALSQTRAAMLWSVKQKYDPSKSLRFNPLITLSLIFVLSPNHNWHIYVL